MSEIVERVVMFACHDEVLLGIVSEPLVAPAEEKRAVLIVVGGPQYRAGAHRMFVQLARTLAKAGHVAMRFDVRGMGDSQGGQRSFEQISDDIGAATDALIRETHGVAEVVLWGLCDAASASLLYLGDRRDPRVRGLCLLNPWVRSPETLARAHVKQYYMRRVIDPQTWRRLLTGDLGLKPLGDLCRTLLLAFSPSNSATDPAKNIGKLPYQLLMSQAWLDFDGEVLLALSGDDLTATEFLQRVEIDPALQSAIAGPKVFRLHLPNADHTLSDSKSRSALEEATLRWLRGATALPAA